MFGDVTMEKMIIGSLNVFLIGAIFGGVVALVILQFVKQRRIIEKRTDPIYYRIFSKKKNNLRSIVAYLEKNKKITNNEVKKLLNVSESAVGGYLDELEEENIIVQRGKTGKNAFYILKR